jgi:hypothetical protein
MRSRVLKSIPTLRRRQSRKGFKKTFQREGLKRDLLTTSPRGLASVAMVLKRRWTKPLRGG